MKKFLLLLALWVPVCLVYAQGPPSHRPAHPQHSAASHRSGRPHKGAQRHDDRLDRHHAAPAHARSVRHHAATQHRGPGNGHRVHAKGHRAPVPCITEHQRLWNGCHVRHSVGRISIYNHRGDKILWGDEVILLWDGYYKVRNGSFWRVYNPVGEMITNIWGDIVDLMEDGLFRCYRAGIYHYYDIYGNEHRF